MQIAAAAPAPAQTPAAAPAPAAAAPAPAAAEKPVTPLWDNKQLGVLHAGKQFPLWNAAGGGRFERLDGVSSFTDALKAVRELRGKQASGAPRLEHAVTEHPQDGSWWAASLSSYWKHETPWWMPIQEPVSRYRGKERIDSARGISLGPIQKQPKYQVSAVHADLRGVIGDTFAVEFPAGAQLREPRKPQRIEKLLQGAAS